MLEPCQRCFYTIMANFNGSLKAVDCLIHSVRYDMFIDKCWRPTQMASSGHLRRCSDADTPNKCLSRAKDDSIQSWPTLMDKCWRPTQMASSGHLRRCFNSNKQNKCLSRPKDASILSWPTLMGH
eukprot:scaffold15719_cov74-Skeletonema_dohrnii-CCMP3373.AAC.1